MFDHAKLGARSDYETLEKNWEDMAKVLNYCVGPTELRKDDEEISDSEDYGGDLCRCGEEK